MKPFLRPTNRGRLAPVGWVAEPAGRWGGKQVEVIYDPRRHDVVLFRNQPSANIRAGIGGAGYRRIAVDGDQELWVRDRVAEVRASLHRLEHAATQARAADIGRRRL